MSDLPRTHHRRDPDTGGAFAVECPGCQAHVAVTRDLVGRAAGCPVCRGAFLVPRAIPIVVRPRGAAEPVATDAAAAEPAPTVASSAPDDEPVVFADPPLPSTRHRQVEAAPADTYSAEPAPAPTGSPPSLGVDLAAPPETSGSAAAEFSFREPVKTIRSGDAEIELRRLTPEEKRARRARRNLLILVVGAALLVALVVILGKGTGGPHPRP